MTKMALISKRYINKELIISLVFEVISIWTYLFYSEFQITIFSGASDGRHEG